MRTAIFSAILFLAFTAPHVALAADDDTVRGLLVVCEAQDQACMIDILSGLQQAIYVGDACPAPDLDAATIVSAVLDPLKSAVAKTPSVADQKTDIAVMRTVKTLYPCPPPGSVLPD